MIPRTRSAQAPATSSTPPGQYLVTRLLADTPDATDTSAPVRISGVANDAGVTDSFRTRIKLSQRALDSFMSNPVMLLNHDVHNPIGTFTKIEYRGNQLHVEGEIDPNARTNTGANVADLARKGILRALSIRFNDATETRAADHTQLDADTLEEISVVTLPSNRASLFNLRSRGIDLHGAPELLDEEDRGRVADLRTPATTRAAGPLSFEVLSQRLRKVIRETEDRDDYGYSCAYVVAIYDDVVIWTTWDDSRFYQRAYAVDTNGNVTLQGENQEVIATWTPVGEPGTRTQPATSSGTRLHPDDLAAITAQVTRALTPGGGQIRAAPSPVFATPPAQPPAPAPTDEISLDQGLAHLRNVISSTPPAPASTSETVSMDAVREAIRTAANT